MSELQGRLAKVITNEKLSSNGDLIRWDNQGTKRTKGLCTHLLETGQWAMITRLEHISPTLLFELGDLEVAMH
eukprot:7978911-Pyramimonas_sp.AAC.1